MIRECVFIMCNKLSIKVMVRNQILIFLAVSLVAGDRLENVRQPHLATNIAAAGHGSALSVPHQNSAEFYKSLNKQQTNSYTTGAPLLHKLYHTPSSYTSGNTHRDIISTVKHSSEPNNGDGSYSYNYETANGISVSEHGVYKPGPTDEEGIQSASGSYSYTGPDNVQYTVTYTAGVEGFVPIGAHIPTPPPIPQAIQKILQYNVGDNLNKYERYIPPSVNEGIRRYTSAYPAPYSGYNFNTDYKVEENARK